ncbi:Listeria/Bacterioides repeat-containing protein [Butyrivibrio proteoclasticus]|uniref:Listeria/Bacterioides repeat-containing protein n=1 Tax=Butyrivibrio proteoclasticus TaxID=43305 RepID=A0A1I5WQU5_9FIRM|nr:DUF4214 domain-containing protein [Butyrivibrio proteoclasticus]SFQ22175.1 Listeria/Bacterioides repeat-containing protein [Butyrivibrio proteoclasticus]
MKVESIRKNGFILLAIVVSMFIFLGICTTARASEQVGELAESDKGVSTSCNIQAPSFSLPTIDGETITESTYASKTQLLVFYRGDGSCGNSNSIFSSIASSYWISNKNIQVIAIEADGASKETVTSFKNSKAPNDNNIVWAYNGYRYMWNYIPGGRLTYAVCAIVKDGMEVEYWDKCDDAETCAEYLRKYVDIGPDSSLGTVLVSGTYCGSMARSMFNSVNGFRTKSNVWQWNSDNSTKTYFNTSGTTSLQPLQYDYDLEKAAMERAKELAVMYSHTRPNGRSKGSITRRNGGENIAYGYRTADSVLEAWIEEDDPYEYQGHRRNMLDSRHTTIGIGCFYTNGTYYWVQEFGNVNGGPTSTSVNDNKVVETVEYSSNMVDISKCYMTLSFDGNGGASALNFDTYYYGKPLEELFYSTRKGYKLDGWYTDPVGGTKIVESTVVDLIGDMTVYAHWVPKPTAVVTKAPVANNLTYNRGFQQLVTAGEASGGTLKYASGWDSTTEPSEYYYSENIPTECYAGTYYVWYKVFGNDDYEDSDAVCIAVNIQEPVDPVVGFVTRMYQVALGREPDEDGLNNWVNQLRSGAKNGADIAQGFYLSPEMINKGLSNDDYVELAYTGIMGRGSDEGGKRDWVEALQCGVTYNAIVKGFVGSQEFISLCESYEIYPGEVQVTENRDKNVGITKFVSRLYTEVLGRGFDEAGLNDWTGQINANPSKENILNISTNGFLHSQEFANRGLSNEDYVRVMYNTYLGRQPDEAGFNDWVSQLNNGRSRDDIASGFANSQEFANILAQYGL